MPTLCGNGIRDYLKTDRAFQRGFDIWFGGPFNAWHLVYHELLSSLNGGSRHAARSSVVYGLPFS